MICQPARLLLVALPALSLLAQTHPSTQTATAAADTTLRVTARLVQVSVVVHDHHGRPVSDLTKDDFEILDQGKPQSIRLFTVDSVNASPPAASKKPAFFPRNVVTNRPEHQAGVPTSVTVLLLDMYNTRLTDQMYGRKQIIRFLRQLRPEDRVAVYLLRGNGFSVVHDFTNSAEGLMASLAKVLPGFSPELDGSEIARSDTGNADADSLFDSSNTIMANFFTRNRVLNTCLAFKVLARHLAGIPGRKNVVWLSGGFPTLLGFGDPDDHVDGATIAHGAGPVDKEIFASYIESASQEMNNATVAIYPVDARGLMGLPMADASKRIPINPRTGRIPDSYNRVDTRNIDTMNYLADLTGGKAFYNTNDLGGAIRKAIDESAVTYTLGYYLDEDRWDNKFHRIKVRVRGSGVTLRAKKGYFARELPAPSTSALDANLREAVWSPLDSTSIGLTARVDPSPAVPNATRLQFSLDTSEVSFQKVDDRFVSSLDVVLAQQTKKGKLLTDFKKTISIRATPEQFIQLRAQGLAAGEDLKVRPDTEAVRIVVLDRGSGIAGSVTVPVTPADRSGATPGAAPQAEPTAAKSAPRQ